MIGNLFQSHYYPRRSNDSVSGGDDNDLEQQRVSASSSRTSSPPPRRTPFRSRSKQGLTRTKSSSSISSNNKKADNETTTRKKKDKHHKKDKGDNGTKKNENNESASACPTADLDPLVFLEQQEAKQNKKDKKKDRHHGSFTKSMLKFGTLKRSDGKETSRSSPKQKKSSSSKSKSKSKSHNAKEDKEEDAAPSSPRSPKSPKREKGHKHHHKKSSSSSPKTSSSSSKEKAAKKSQEPNALPPLLVEEETSDAEHAAPASLLLSPSRTTSTLSSESPHNSPSKQSSPIASDATITTVGASTITSLTTTTEDEKTISSAASSTAASSLSSPTRKQQHHKGVLRTKSTDHDTLSPRSSPKHRTVRRNTSGSKRNRPRTHLAPVEHAVPTILGIYSNTAAAANEPPPPASPMVKVQRFLRRNSLKSTPVVPSLDDISSSQPDSLLTPRKRVTVPDDPVSDVHDDLGFWNDMDDSSSKIAPQDLYWTRKEIKQMLVRAQKLAQQVAYDRQNAGGSSEILQCLRLCYGFGNTAEPTLSKMMMGRRQSFTSGSGGSMDGSALSSPTKSPPNAKKASSASASLATSNPQQALKYYFSYVVQDEHDEPTTLRGLERHICFAIQDYQNQCIQSVLRAQAEIHEDCELWTPQQEQQALYKQSYQASSMCRRFARLIAKADSASVGTKNGRSVAVSRTMSSSGSSTQS